MTAILAVGLFPDRQVGFFEKLCRDFPVLAFSDCGFPSGNRFPYTPAEELTGGEVSTTAAAVAWQTAEVRAHAEATLAGLMGRPCRIDEEEFGLLYGQVFSALHARERMHRLADATRVDLVLTSADYDSLRRPWVRAARERGIPTLCIEHGFWAQIPQPEIMKPEYRRHLAYASNHVNLDNAIEVEAARRAHGTVFPDHSPPDYLALGTPQDSVLDGTLDREAARRSLGLETEKFTLTFLGSWVEARTPGDLFESQIEAAEFHRGLMSEFACWEHRDRSQLVIKLHPGFRDATLFAEARRCLLDMADRAGCPRPLITAERLPESVAAADVLVGYGFTSVFWDAFLCDRPSIVVPIPHYADRLIEPGALERGNLFLESGIIRPAFTAREVFARAEELISPDGRQQFLDTVAGVKQRYAIRHRTAAEKSERICDWIRRRLET